MKTNKKTKKIISLGIITLALVTSFFISQDKEMNIDNKQSNNFFIIENPKTEKTNLNNLSPNFNFTNLFNKKMLETIIVKNQDLLENQKNLNNLKVNPDKELVEKTVDELINKKIYFEKIKPEEITINEDDSPLTNLLYALFIKELLKKTIDDINQIDLENNDEITLYFQKIAHQFNESFEILKSVYPPQSFKNVHLTTLEFLLKNYHYFNYLANASKDPLSAYITMYQIIGLDQEKELKNILAEIKKILVDKKIIQS